MKFVDKVFCAIVWLELEHAKEGIWANSLNFFLIFEATEIASFKLFIMPFFLCVVAVTLPI